MYPVKVYDKHGNLIKEYTQDELNKRSDEILFAKRGRGMNWRKSALVKKEASQTNNKLFARVLDNLKKGTDLCKPAPSDLKSEKVPHSGKSKDTTGESGKE